MAGASEGAHAAVFKLFHEDKPANLNLEMIADVLADHGVDKAQFLQSFQSPAVTDKVNAAKEMTKRYRITGVPTLVIDGRYTVQIPSSGDLGRVFEVTDHLVAEAAR
jgi:thiol:disulfide interchange protein DsbA